MHQVIAIVGCGATGTSLFLQIVRALVRSGTSRVKVYLFDGSGLFGPGLAYRCPKTLLMNSPCSMVNALPEDDMENCDFLQWIKLRPEVWTPEFSDHAYVYGLQSESFAPRRLVGLYLADLVQRHIEMAAAAGIEVVKVAQPVTRVSPDGDSRVTCRVHCPDGFSVAARHVAFCVGNLGPNAGYAHLSKCERFLPTVYVEDERIQAIPPGSRVLILGASLSAIDAVILLKGRGVHLTLASRRGLLPAVKAGIPWRVEYKHMATEPLRQWLTPKVTVPELHKTIDAELAEINGPAEGSVRNLFDRPIATYRDARSMLEHDIGRAGGKWEDIQYAFIGQVDTFFRAFSLEERARFKEFYGRSIHRYTSSFPLEVAVKLRAMMDAGELRLRRLCSGVDIDGDAFRAELADGPAEAVDETFEYVIDASGPSKAYRFDCPLLAQMDAEGLMDFNEDNSVPIDVATFEFPTRLGAHCYAAGATTNGNFFYTNFLPVGTAHAQKAAKTIVSNIVAAASVTLSETETFSTGTAAPRKASSPGGVPPELRRKNSDCNKPTFHAEVEKVAITVGRAD
eukprot:TRINITY_DN84_c0_g1_i2.p1 TRINITY_DN84_c0_g1~~TRINITY_DN84_c0_g1_i2.p1  ORF type:complete len:605 (+),score=201.87 TRINITY_DN84_c0_g1_i2:117-1817(+)